MQNLQLLYQKKTFPAYRLAEKAKNETNNSYFSETKSLFIFEYNRWTNSFEQET